MESLTSAQAALGSYRLDLCHQWLKHAMPEAQDDPIRRCVLLNNFGLDHRRNHNPVKAARFFQQALQDCEASWLRGRIFANWGVLEHRRGNLVAARRLYQDALNCCSQPVEDEKAVARVCINFAWLHVQQDRGVQADTLLRRARSLVARYPEDTMLECRLHLAMGRAAMAGRRLTKAEADFLQAVRVVQKLDYFDAVLLAQCRAALANCYSLQAFGQLDTSETRKDALERGSQADNLFVESLELLEDADQATSLEYIEALSMAVDHSIRTGQWGVAEARVQKLLELVTGIEHLEAGLKVRAWERATQILRQVGKTQLAERAQRRATALHQEQRGKTAEKPAFLRLEPKQSPATQPEMDQEPPASHPEKLAEITGAQAEEKPKPRPAVLRKPGPAGPAAEPVLEKPAKPRLPRK
jgi:tetratricopeptide (TPR) repeat protein